jgi:GNAT superfamily N-acetyltransferase
MQNTFDRNFFTEAEIDADPRIGAVGPAQRDLLIGMYDRFDPLGAALGLPPFRAESRREWIGGALNHDVNVAAFSPAGEIIGHCFLAPDKQCSAELAIFVHQEFRRRGVGTALVKAALEWACAAGLRRVWSITPSENRAALRLQQSCGFRLMKSIAREAEMEIDLAALAFKNRPLRLGLHQKA